ncbi:MAG: type II secretion system protein [Patescibacteria group bacterium]
MKRLLSKFSSAKGFIQHQLRRSGAGFTLIELLIVIAILGVLATVLIALLDPGDKIKAASDTKVLQDVREIYGANQRYMVQNSASIGTLETPAAPGTLVTSGELKVVPVPPTGYGAAYGYTTITTAGVTDVAVSGQIQSKGAISKSTVANTIGGTACTGGAQVCYVVQTQNKSCYKPAAAPLATEACP